MSNQSGGGGGIGPCTQHEDGWLLSGPAAQRLFDKSAIGLPQPQNKLLLQSSEVIFCARHRHLEIDENWLVNQLNIFPELLHEAAALEALRVPGEKILLSQNVSEINPKIIFSQASWAVRWARSSNVKQGLAKAEVIWVRGNQPIDWLTIYSWASEVDAIGRIAEVLIVDEEMGVTTYRVRPENPEGGLGDIDLSNLAQYSHELYGQGVSGAFLSGLELPEQLGTPLPEGRWVDQDEVNLMVEKSYSGQLQGESDAVLNFEVEAKQLLIDVLGRGLLPRSGFKYGTKWRLYEGSVGDGHAPWLLQPIWMAPSDWAQACLAARLANGVHKTWICGFKLRENWCYISLLRPPADGRWSGFRHEKPKKTKS